MGEQWTTATSTPSTAKLELLAAVSASIRRLGGTPSTVLIDELLDERIATRPREECA